MNRRISLPFLLTAAICCLMVMTGCAPACRQMVGDPQEPYPLASPPRAGDIVHLATGMLLTPQQVLALAGDARIVYVGETHDNPASHRLELGLLQGLAGIHPGRLALGMEMFSRSQQPVLDEWVAGQLDEKTFLKKSRWYEQWKMDFAYYRDILTFAREHRIPVVALNAEKSQIAAIRANKADQLNRNDQALLPELDLGDSYQRALAAAIFGDHSHGGVQRDGFIRAQTLWDETMADSVARYLSGPAGHDKHMLVMAGGHHIAYGFGIPRRVFRRLPVSYLLIGGQEINVGAEKQDRLMDVVLPDFPMRPYDILLYLAYEELPKSGVTLGVVTNPATTGAGLVITEIMSGSTAERAGLQRGDILLSLDGEKLNDTLDLLYALKQKHPGDDAILRIERGGATMERQVTFPQNSGAPMK